jgi:hypothetical protein
LTLKPDFHIHTGELLAEELDHCRLLIEVNARSFSYVLIQLKGMRPLVVKYFQLDPAKERPLAEILAEIIQEDPLLNSFHAETFLVYNFPESNLVPERFFRMDLNKPLTDLVYGDLKKDLILSEKIPWWELHNVYRIPTDVHILLQRQFAGGRYWHFYSLQLKSYKMFTVKEEGEFLKVIFYGDKMVVLVFRDGQLQLAQTFPYHDAKDASYHLLNCCQQLHLDQDKLNLEASGMLERQSALYEELLKYFLQVSFEGIGDNILVTDELKEYPLHYFSSLLKMAVCV